MLIKGLINDNYNTYNFELSVTNIDSPWFYELNINKYERCCITAAEYDLLIKDQYENEILYMENYGAKYNGVELLLILDQVHDVKVTDVLINDIEKDKLPIANELDYILYDEYGYNDGWQLFDELLTGLCSENFLMDIESLLTEYLTESCYDFSTFWDYFEMFYIADNIDTESDIPHLIAKDLINLYIDTDKLKAAV